MPTPTLITSISIPAGGSLSNAVDVTSGTIIRIYVPQEWSAAPMTFMLSADNVMRYSVICLATGQERILQVQPDSIILGSIIPGGWIKFRSGTSQQVIPQKNICNFRMAILP